MRLVLVLLLISGTAYAADPIELVDGLTPEAAKAELTTACTLPAQWATCKTSLETLRDRIAPEDAALVKDLDERVAVWSVAKAKTIGVLLPLTGPQAKVGLAAKEALEVALADLGVKVVVEDSGGEPVKAEAAAKKLIMVDHVAVLLGPIGRQETAAVAVLARKLHVPMVTLATVADAASGRATDMVMRVRTSPLEAAQHLAREARARMGVTRAAVLYPDTDFGKEAAVAFAEELQAAGGDVARLVAYDPATVDFKPIMKALMQAEKPGKKVVADFDAVFIADGPEAVKRITPSFEQWRVPLRTKPLEAVGSGVVTTKGKVVPVQLLGGAAWDSPLIVDRTAGHTDNAVFAVVRADPTSPEAAAFTTRFEAKHGKAPIAFQAEVYDVARFIAKVVGALDGGDQALRLTIQERLRASRTEVGATGTIRVTMGALAPRVQLMTVHGATVRARLSEDDERAQRAGAMSTESP